jgi:hypothetical protein
VKKNTLLIRTVHQHTAQPGLAIVDGSQCTGLMAVDKINNILTVHVKPPIISARITMITRQCLVSGDHYFVLFGHVLRFLNSDGTSP